VTLGKLAGWTLEITNDLELSRKISAANTARHAFDILREHHPEVISHVGRQIVKSAKRFAGINTKIRNIIFDFNGEIVFDSQNQLGANPHKR